MLNRYFKNQKSWLVVRNLVYAEAIAYGIFLGIALSAHWAKIYRKFAISHYVSFTVLEFALLAAVQLCLIVLVVRQSFGEEESVRDLMGDSEHDRLEFKTSLRWDVNRNQVNRDLERSVMKTVTAFLNSRGGALIIGVNDQKRVIGIESDTQSLLKKDHDGFENHFNNVFGSMIGPEFRRFVRLSFHDIDGRDVCLVRVSQAHKPAYLKSDKGEDFFIRTGNATTALKMSEAAAYVASWRR